MQAVFLHHMWKAALMALPMHALPALLFGGGIKDLHKTKFAFKEIVDRYKASIDDVNRSLGVSIGFAIIALYAYIAVPASVDVPFIGLKIPRQNWIRVVPAIGYACKCLDLPRSFGLCCFVLG